MGVLTDLVAATPSEVVSIAESASPAFDFGGVDAKGIDQVKLCKLKAVLTHQPYQGKCVVDFVLVAGDEEEGPWVFSVPADLLLLVTSIEEEQIPEISKQWALAEEFILDGWAPSDVEDSLSEIRELCISAKNDGKAVFMWMSV